MMFSTLTHLLKAAVFITIVFFTPTPVLSQDAVVLVYHRFGEDDVPSTNIRLEQFEDQLNWLIQEGAHFPTLDDVVDALKNDKPLKPFSVLFTVDDAYKSAAVEAWPRLKKHGIPLTVFVSSEPVDQGLDRYMTWDDIRELKKAGVTIGFHGHSHAHMAFLSKSAAKKDMKKGIARFKDELGEKPMYFAYPYGEYSKDLQHLVKELCFEAAFAQFSGVASAYSDRHALPRFAINERYGTPSRFQLVTKARAMPVVDADPRDALVTPNDQNPPPVRLKFDDKADAWQGVSCFPSHLQGSAPVQWNEGALKVDLVQPLPKGRSRLNCTARLNGVWYWYGMPFLVPGGVLD